MKLPLLLSTCFLSMLLTGCPGPRMGVKVTDLSAKHLSLEMLTYDDLLKTTYPQKISSIYFSRKSKKEGMDDIWSVKSQEKDGRTLTKIVYGETPVGFNATTPQPLFPGDALYVTFYSVPSPLRTVEVTVSK